MRFTVTEKTPAEWAAWAVTLPDAERREKFIEIAIESAYKSGFTAGMKHDATKPMPWETKD